MSQERCETRAQLGARRSGRAQLGAQRSGRVTASVSAPLHRSQRVGLATPVHGRGRSSPPKRGSPSVTSREETASLGATWLSWETGFTKEMNKTK